MRAVEQHDVADDLRDVALALGRDLFGGRVAIEVGAISDLHLDQLVIGERLLDCLDQALIDPALADMDEWMQRVTESAKVVALLTGQHERAL